MIIADTSGLLALFNAGEPQHAAVVHAIETRAERLVVSPYVIAELDYLIATRVGLHAELAVLAELTTGAYELPDLDAGALRAAAAVISRYSDPNIGVADASLVVLAERYATPTVLTLDHRHFEVLRTTGGGPFEILP